MKDHGGAREYLVVEMSIRTSFSEQAILDFCGAAGLRLRRPPTLQLHKPNHEVERLQLILLDDGLAKCYRSIWPHNVTIIDLALQQSAVERHQVLSVLRDCLLHHAEFLIQSSVGRFRALDSKWYGPFEPSMGFELS